MGTVAGSGALDRNANTRRPACFDESSNVFLPPGSIEVDRQKPARFVIEQRVDTHDMLATQMVEDHAIVDREEGLVRAIAALASGLQTADPRLELVGARRSVACFARLSAHESGGEDIGAPTEQRAEETDLLSRGPGNFGRRAGLNGACRRRGRGQLHPQRLDARNHICVRSRELRQVILFAGQVLQDGVLRSGHMALPTRSTAQLHSRAPVS
jgi:hypothetical protein